MRKCVCDGLFSCEHFARKGKSQDEPSTFYYLESYANNSNTNIKKAQSRKIDLFPIVQKLSHYSIIPNHNVSHAKHTLCHAVAKLILLSDFAHFSSS